MSAPTASDWITADRDHRADLYPVDDLVAHEIEGDETCVCGPELFHLGHGKWLHAHHSLDDRECLEDEGG